MSRLSNVLPLCLVGTWFRSSADPLRELPPADESGALESAGGAARVRSVDAQRHAHLPLGACLLDSSFQGAQARN
jgi:hypothetical protein